MEVTLEQVSKRFARHWVFRDFSAHIAQGSRTAVTGRNGAGKSTLLKLVCGALPLSRGKIVHAMNNTYIPQTELHKHISLAAPYSHVIEEFTLPELLQFQIRFKPMYDGIESFERFFKILDYPFRKDVSIRHYSSGMKQRIRLALALCAESELLLLDEPGSNLDAAGKQWFQALLAKYAQDRTVLIASNEKEDFALCDTQIDLESL